MEYLARWRMMLAGDKLANSGETISQIAYSIGYESDSAFSAAFRRVMGCSPPTCNLQTASPCFSTS